MQVFESCDYVIFGHSRLNDVQLMGLMEENAPPEYGKPILTYLTTLPVESNYLNNGESWRDEPPKKI